MTASDLAAGQALSAEQRWPHRLVDWEQMFAHAEGVVAELDGAVVGTAMRWSWGERHATLGLVIVSPACQGARIGHRLMTALMDGQDHRTLLLNATPVARKLYERLGFVHTGDLVQHQGLALPSPPVALEPGWRLRAVGPSDLADLQRLDAAARGMPRDGLIAQLMADGDLTVVLDLDGAAQGFGILRRFGRGHLIGPVVAPDENGAKAMIAHLSGSVAGRFVRIDIEAASGLSEWLVETIGLARVDLPTKMRRVAAGTEATGAEPTAGAPVLYAVASQAMG